MEEQILARLDQIVAVMETIDVLVKGAVGFTVVALLMVVFSVFSNNGD